MSALPRSTRILLKARPTTAQLADRLAEPVPEGLELYLDRVDLQGDGWLERIRAVAQPEQRPAGFTWIVEAPIRTLGGAFFSLAADDADHRETLARVIRAGREIGAVAANVHLVAPTRDPRELTAASRRQQLARPRPLLEYYLKSCREAGLVPQIENVPPVGRMRESAYIFSPIGSAPDDLRSLVEAYPGLRLTVDVSHAALYLNWRAVPLDQVEPEHRPVAVFARSEPGPSDLAAYVADLLDITTTVHVSNASGLLGEGLGYAAGDEDLDRCLGPAIGRVSYIVTETLEPRPEEATGMREAQARLIALRARAESVM